MSFEESLIWHASPTLAKIKVANLYNFRFTTVQECVRTIRQFNSWMNLKGLYIELVKKTDDFYLIYIYRKAQLEKELGDAGVREFLSEYGYPLNADIAEYLKILKQRLCENENFPHEIGVFLGYPLADVKSFIEMKGKNAVACGDWKVYHDEQNAKNIFGKLKRCREVYMRVYEGGRRLCDMTVGE